MELNSKIMMFFCLALISVGVCQGTPPDSRTCTIRFRILNHGVSFEPQQCNICSCQDAKFDCAKMDPKDCRDPDCGPAEPVSTPGRCCKVCPGTGARCWFNGMTVEDGETFQQDPKGSCTCQAGKITCV